MKYTQQDKARILRVTTRTLQRWRTTKPELYAIIEASFILREAISLDEETDKKVKEMIKEAIPENSKI
ncbi:hypothetical protein [uncultured Campylobacter sp.]|nr:hypothetical protein [uncultured Campylobacter sp.]